MANASPNARGPNATYIPPVHVGVELGVYVIALGKLRVALGPQEFLDTNMLVSATRKSRVGGIAQSESPTRVVSRCSGI